ncbi:hypothetical protein [Methanoregula sp.]|jgi:hypothetical protein|uniref:hypothetical protein n=1 Tax=Methanoregula sp. TaxID=2052170 RepID=UPI003C760395
MKAGQKFIFISEKARTYPVYRKNGDGYLMHEGMNPGMMQQHEMMMQEMWDSLTEDQKKTLAKRMLDGKIMMKEEMIKHFQFKIETMRLIKKMLDEC